MKRRVRVGLALLLIISVVSLGIIGCAKEEAAVTPTGEFPSVLTVATFGSGTAAYVDIAALSPVFKEVAGVRLRADPTDVRISQFKMIRVGETDTAYVHIGTAWRPIFATEEFCNRDWGPQRLRMSYQLSPYYNMPYVKATSDIKTIADLKGRKCAVYPGSELFWNGYLAFANLSLDDVQVVPASGYSAHGKMVLEGKAEAGYGATTSTIWVELAASPGGIRPLLMPFEDTEGWKRMRAVCPADIPAIVPEGVGIKETWGLPSAAYSRAWYSYPEQSETNAYLIAKVMYEGYPIYKDKVAEFVYFTPEHALDVLDVPCPYHAGAIKFFKEKGVWTAEHEAWQKEQLELQDNMVEAWGEALKEAESKGLSVDSQNKEWLSLWDSYWKKYWSP